METQNKTQKTLNWNYMCELKKEILAMENNLWEARVKKPTATITTEDMRVEAMMYKSGVESMTQKFKAYTRAQSNYIRLLKEELKEKVV